MVEVILFGLVPGGLLLYVGRRIGESQPPEQAARHLLYFLLAVLLIILTGGLFVDGQQISSLLMTITAPVAAVIIPLIYMHWRANLSLHTRQITITLLVSAAAVVGLIFGYAQIHRDIYWALMTVGSGAVIALIWLLIRASGWGRWLAWLALGITVTAVLAQGFLQNATILNWPQWLQTSLELVAWIVWPIASVTLIGVIVQKYIAAQNKRLHKLIGLVAVGLIIALVAYQQNEATTLDSATDGLRTAAIITFMGISAAAIGLLLAWKNNIRTVTIYAALILAGAFGITAVVHDNLQHRPPDVTEARAVSINEAVQSYFAANGHYPADLNALIPRYMLYIPNPMLFNQQTWCYEGGSDYYRLGYVHRKTFGMPAEYITIKVTGSAGEFPTENWVCDTQLADYRERYAPIEYSGG